MVLNSEPIADTMLAEHVLETSHPPTHDITPQDTRQQFVQACEFCGGRRTGDMMGLFTVDRGTMEC